MKNENKSNLKKRRALENREENTLPWLKKTKNQFMEVNNTFKNISTFYKQTNLMHYSHSSFPASISAILLKASLLPQTNIFSSGR